MKLDPLDYRAREKLGLPHIEHCNELPDWAFVSAIRTVVTIRNPPALYPGSADARTQVARNGAASRWDIAAVIAGHPEDILAHTSTQEYPGVPPKLILAKALKLIKRGLIDGCACGCRGDFTVRKQQL